MRERFIALAGCYEDVAAMVEINPSEGCVSVNLLKSSRKLFHNASAGGGGGGPFHSAGPRCLRSSRRRRGIRGGFSRFFVFRGVGEINEPALPSPLHLVPAREAADEASRN